MSVVTTHRAGSSKVAAIHDLLARDPVCLEIVHYLTQNSGAADTVRGIAEWWIKRDVPTTLEALLRLQESGIVESYAIQDYGAFVYAYTRNPILRYLVTRCVAGTSRERDRWPDRVGGL
jgi:hypothetical protein